MHLVSWVDLSHFESLVFSNVVEKFTHYFPANKHLLSYAASQNLTLCVQLRSSLLCVTGA